MFVQCGSSCLVWTYVNYSVFACAVCSLLRMTLTLSTSQHNYTIAKKERKQWRHRGNKICPSKHLEYSFPFCNQLSTACLLQMSEQSEEEKQRKSEMQQI